MTGHLTQCSGITKKRYNAAPSRSVQKKQKSKDTNKISGRAQYSCTRTKNYIIQQLKEKLINMEKSAFA